MAYMYATNPNIIKWRAHSMFSHYGIATRNLVALEDGNVCDIGSRGHYNDN